MINECTLVLEEKVVSKPETIDFAMIMGGRLSSFLRGAFKVCGAGRIECYFA